LRTLRSLINVPRLFIRRERSASLGRKH